MNHTTPTADDGEIDKILKLYDAFFVSEQAMNNGRSITKSAIQQLIDRKVLEGQNKLLNIGTGNAEGLASVNMGEVSDGYHTFNELYEFRMLYNAALFNEWGKHKTCPVIKSKRSSDGELCFDGGWFIVVAQLPTGQISNHYELKDWDLFDITEYERAPEWDGHTPQDVAKRLRDFLNPSRLTAQREGGNPTPANEKGL